MVTLKIYVERANGQRVPVSFSGVEVPPLEGTEIPGHTDYSGTLIFHDQRKGMLSPGLFYMRDGRGLGAAFPGDKLVFEVA